MSDKKLIAVVGACGTQGSSVLTYLLNTGRYRVRALTRNILKADALTLKTRWGADLELVQCDIRNPDQVIKAFTGCWGAYCMTDFFSDPKDMITKEFDYGRILIDSAVEANLTHCVWSSLPNVAGVSNGLLTVPHFTSKYLVEEYARNEFKGRTNVRTTFSFVYPGFYLQNLLIGIPGFRLHLNKEGLLYNEPLPLETTTKLPLLNMNEFGGFVLPLFDNYKQFINSRLFAYNGLATMPELMNWVADTLNTKAIYIKCTYDEYFQLTESNEFVHMLRWINEYGLFGGLDVVDPHKYYPGAMNIGEAVKSLNWRTAIKPGLTQLITSRIGEISGVIIEKLGELKDTMVKTAEQLRERVTTQVETFSRQAE